MQHNNFTPARTSGWQWTMMRSSAGPCGGSISQYGLKTKIKWIESQIKALHAQIRELPDKVKIKEVRDKDKIIRLISSRILMETKWK